MSNEPEPIYMTEEGIEKLRQELNDLVSVKRPALAERLRRAIQQGDLSENADYITAKEEQGFLEGRIQQIEETLRRARIIEERGPTERIGLGNRVTVVELGADDQEVFKIVGSTEADPASGRVSNESPLGQALMGREVGDVVTIRAPGGEIAFRVLDIG